MPAQKLTDDKIAKWVLLSVFTSGVILLSFFLWHSHAVHRASQWFSVEATVVQSAVTFTTNLVEGRLGNRVGYNSEVVFSFSYTVSGHEYVSDSFYVFGKPPAGIVHRDFPRGHRFRALYDPNNPARAVVEPGPLRYRPLLLSVICLLLAMAGAIYNRRITK